MVVPNGNNRFGGGYTYSNYRAQFFLSLETRTLNRRISPPCPPSVSPAGGISHIIRYPRKSRAHPGQGMRHWAPGLTMGARFCAIMSLGDRITGRYDRALSAAFRSYLWISFSLSVNAAWPEPLNFATVLKSRVITQIYPLRSFFSTTSFQKTSFSFILPSMSPSLPGHRVSATIVWAIFYWE